LLCQFGSAQFLGGLTNPTGSRCPCRDT
jgi:hypothetical protein